jgi:hypothetical protein
LLNHYLKNARHLFEVQKTVLDQMVVRYCLGIPKFTPFD